MILVAVDVADGIPVTFDSYAKADGSRKTEYGRYLKEQDGKEIGFERIIRYDDGITLDQVMASGCYPINFDYTLLEVESYYPDSVSNNDLMQGEKMMVAIESALVLAHLLIVTSLDNTGKRYDTFGMVDC